MAARGRHQRRLRVLGEREFGLGSFHINRDWVRDSAALTSSNTARAGKQQARLYTDGLASWPGKMKAMLIGADEWGDDELRPKTLFQLFCQARLPLATPRPSNRKITRPRNPRARK
jgi:hypothetical protein